MTKKEKAGTIGWMDLTVDDAIEIRDFYKKVTGWKHTSVPMGDYEDFCVMPENTEEPVAGICHKKGQNASLPSQWIIYIYVEDLEKSLRSCTENGGKIIVGSKQAGNQGKYAIIQDPAGAAVAIFEPTE